MTTITLGTSGWRVRRDVIGSYTAALFITGIVASQLNVSALAASLGSLAFSMHQCRNAPAPALKVEHCSIVISRSTDRKMRERAFNSRGHAYMALNRFAEAVNDFTAVIRLNPKVAGYYDNRQNAFKALGRLDDALADANIAVRLAPAYSFVYGARADVYTELGRYDLAIQDLTTAISLDPNDASLLVGRGKIFVKAGRLPDAIADFTHALEINGTMTAALRERGLAYKLEDNFDAARSDLSLFLRLEPNDVEVAQALQDIAAPVPTPAPTSANQQCGFTGEPVCSLEVTGEGPRLEDLQSSENRPTYADLLTEPFLWQSQILETTSPGLYIISKQNVKVITRKILKA